jgi:hypothetical protein
MYFYSDIHMPRGYKHDPVGGGLSQPEWESTTSHILASGASFPGTPVESEEFWRSDLNTKHIYDGSEWLALTPIAAILADGSVELSAAWDVGGFNITNIGTMTSTVISLSVAVRPENLMPYSTNTYIKIADASGTNRFDITGLDSATDFGIVPIVTGRGNIGTSSLAWQAGYFNTLSLDDDKKIILGTGNDGEIYVSADNLYIENTTANKDVYIRGDKGSGQTSLAWWDTSTARLYLYDDIRMYGSLTYGATPSSYRIFYAYDTGFDLNSPTRIFEGYIDNGATITTDHDMIGIEITHVWSGDSDGNNPNLYGGSFTSLMSTSTSTVNNLIGVYGHGYGGASQAAVNNVRGGYFLADPAAATGTIDARGVYAHVVESSPIDNSTIANAYAVYGHIDIPHVYNDNFITNAYGVYSYVQNSRNAGGDSKIDNVYLFYGDTSLAASSDLFDIVYGLYLNLDVTDVTGATYGVYVTGESQNYFSADVGIGSTALPSANGGKVLFFGDNTADPTMGTATAGVYGKDVSGTVELFAVDAADNATQLSSHNELGEWIHNSYNTRTGKKLYINMEQMVRKLETATGMKFIDNEDDDMIHISKTDFDILLERKIEEKLQALGLV